MARYLTPSKIGLLALVSVYTESVVPAAATVPILSFLISHLLPHTTAQSSHVAVAGLLDFTTSIDVLREATISHASGIPGRTIWDLLLNELWRIDSLDALHVYFDSLSLLLQKNNESHGESAESDVATNRILLSRVSPLGVFVRRAQLEFSRLQFLDGSTLWQSFKAYRFPTWSQWAKRNPKPFHKSPNVYLEDDQLATVDDSVFEPIHGSGIDTIRREVDVSSDDVEKILEHQVDRMQSLGIRLPEDMVYQLRQMVETNVSLPNLSQYVKFLDAWKMGDYPASFDNLHKYFDYTMHNRDRTFYQYALLNLAILHADFGIYSEAIIAMQEAISTAREQNDLGCLTYSLSWLYHFSKAHPEHMDLVQGKGILGTDREALTFLKAKAKETSMWSILSTALLSEARLTLSNGDNVSHALESVLKASHINIMKNVPNAVGSQMIIESSIFGKLGITCQSWLSEALFLQCYQRSSPAEDVLHCVCRSAFLLAQRGRYEEALACMQQLDQEILRTLKYHQCWTAHLGMLKMRKCLYSNELDAAQHILSQLHAVRDSSYDLSYSVILLEIDLQLRRKDHVQALEILEKLAKKLDAGDFDIYQRIKLMVVKAHVYEEAGNPQKSFSVALRAATLAYRAKILPVLWEAICAICAVFHSVKEFDASMKLLGSIMPQVLECEDCDLSARSLSLLADAHVGLAGLARADSLQRKEQLTKGMENLDRAFDEYSKIEDVKRQCEMRAKKAIIMHLNGDPALANDCAAQYLAIMNAAKEQN